MIVISDEAIRAAARAAYGVHYERYQGLMRKALEAAIPHLVFASPLDWMRPGNCHNDCMTSDDCLRRPRCDDPPGSL